MRLNHLKFLSFCFSFSFTENHTVNESNLQTCRIKLNWILSGWVCWTKQHDHRTAGMSMSMKEIDANEMEYFCFRYTECDWRDTGRFRVEKYRNDVWFGGIGWIILVAVARRIYMNEPNKSAEQRQSIRLVGNYDLWSYRVSNVLDSWRVDVRGTSAMRGDCSCAGWTIENEYSETHNSLPMSIDFLYRIFFVSGNVSMTMVVAVCGDSQRQFIHIYSLVADEIRRIWTSLVSTSIAKYLRKPIIAIFHTLRHRKFVWIQRLFRSI